MSATAETSVTGLLVRLVGSEVVADSTRAFRFTRPAGLTFKAGQAIDLVLPGLAEGAQRHAFSIASAPFEHEILIATRIRASPFKSALAQLAADAPARLEGPFGSLTMHRKANRDAVLIAGGIGITPFLSMLRQARNDADPRRFTLLYSNRRRADAAFLAELERMARDHAGLHLVATMTEEGGRKIDAAMIRDAGARLTDPVFYVAGPPGLVAAVRTALAEAGIEDDDVRGEEFFGY